MKESFEPRDFPYFKDLEKSVLDGKRVDLLSPLEYFSSNELGVNWNDIRYSNSLINELVDMVQRRRVYFHVYHKVEMGELNEASLICFWILKLKPFYNTRNLDENINVVYALALFTRAVNYTAEKNCKKANFTVRNVEHLIHSFRCRDLSKEAIMAIAESMV